MFSVNNDDMPLITIKKPLGEKKKKAKGTTQ